MMISHQIVCISLSLAAPLEPFTHRQMNHHSIIFIGITLIDAHLNWMN